MKRALLSLLYPLAALTCCFGQSANSISGTVRDSADNSPVPGCSVFINGSSRGTITDAKGVFVLAHIPAGNYDLVVSAIGYETYILNFSDNRLPLDLKIRLKQRASELSAVTVEPYLKDGWQRWGRFFINNFIGTGDNALRCMIRNPEVLRFRYSERRGQLTVSATEPLIIENNALGYLLRYQLETFTYGNDSHIIFYVGYPFFTEMAGGRRKQRDWTNERRKAYLGSMMQFMRGLYRDSLQQEGFTVSQKRRMPNLEKRRIKACFDSTQTKPGTLPADTLHYYLAVLNQPDFYQYVVPVRMDSLLSLTTGPEKSLFFRGVLDLLYSNNKEGISHRQSELWLLTPAPARIWSNGSYFPPTEVFSAGYWSHSEKISNMLPLDYELP